MMATAPPVTASTEGRRFTTVDSIGMTLLGSIYVSSPWLDEDGLFSPDSCYFAKVTHRGVLPEGVTEGVIWLFDTRAIRAGINDPDTCLPSPLALVTLRSAVNGLSSKLESGDVISGLRWSSDSRTLAFRACAGRENRQLFLVDIASREQRVLTPADQDVVDYSWIGGGNGTFAYLAASDVREASAWWSNDPETADIATGTGHALVELLYPNFWNRVLRVLPAPFELWRIDDGVGEPIIDRATGKPIRFIGDFLATMIAPSPDGRRLVTVAQAEHVPQSWERYGPADAMARGFKADHEDRECDDRPIDAGRALQYQLVDLEAGTRKPLLDAPVADYHRGWQGRLCAAWAPDSRSVAVCETYLPLTMTTNACVAAVITIEPAAIACVRSHADQHSEAPVGLCWSEDGLALTLLGSRSGTVIDHRETFRMTYGQWSSTPAVVPAPDPPLEIVIHEGLDLPPVLVARDPTTGRSRTIFDPNPQLAGIALGEMTSLSWTDGRGQTIQGGLLKPPGFVAGRRYGLVIQTHGFNPSCFYRVGYAETGSAGRALAGRDLLVLQVAEPDPLELKSPDEIVAHGPDVYLAAIDKLVAEGLVDGRRVGISGYSKTGLYVATSITRTPDRFAAAVIANSDPGTLSGYHHYVDYFSPLFIEVAAAAFGGSRPYGDGIKGWLEHAPSFLTDRVEAPVLFSAADPQHLLSVWGLYAPLRDQGKPVELQYIRSGQHNITKPLQLLAHQEIIVDWFDFWLNEHEDVDSAKAAQYRRWRRLRASRDPNPK